MKKNILRFLSGILLFSTSLFAQGPYYDWAVTYGNIANESVKDSEIDSNGDIISVGRFNNTADFDPGEGEFLITPLGDQTDTYIQKLDSEGNFLWAKSIGGGLETYPNSLEIDVNGYIYRDIFTKR